MWNAPSLKVRSAPGDFHPGESSPVSFFFFNKSKKRKKSCSCVLFGLKDDWKHLRHRWFACRRGQKHGRLSFGLFLSKLWICLSVCAVYAACSTDWQECWFDVRLSRRKQTSHEEEHGRVSVSRRLRTLRGNQSGLSAWLASASASFMTFTVQRPYIWKMAASRRRKRRDWKFRARRLGGETGKRGNGAMGE